jgi:small conductance mechanosensitive channel
MFPKVPASEGTPTPTPSPTGTPQLPDVSIEGVQNAIREACVGADEGVLCEIVRDVTHSDKLASSAEVFLGVPLRIMFLLAIAFVARALIHRFIRRTTTRIAAGGSSSRIFRVTRANSLFGDPASMAERRKQRAETVGSLLRSVTSIGVFGTALLSILSELGINIAPIVASAGVLGLAVGFGAQNLVRDFLSGMFMLLEDQYGVGDVIDVGEASGVVEAVTFRVTRLRDVEGTVWYVRNGEIIRIGNRSQGWARAVLDVPLNYETEVSRAKEILQDAVDALWRDGAWAKLIIDEPEVWGVESMTEAGYTVRVVVKTQPLKQWEVSRELRQRIRETFATEGIQLGSLQRSEITVRDEEDEFPPRRRGDEEEEETGMEDITVTT